MSMLGVQISLSAGGVCVPDVPIDHGLGLLGRREMDKKREASALCGAVDF